MSAPLSIIIPALNAAGDLPVCLSSLMPGLAGGLLREVVLVDGGSSDETKGLAQAAGCNVLSAPAGRANQLIAGAHAARGAWLLFLHADTALSPEWVERVDNHIEERPTQAATFQLAYRSDAREAKWLASRANRRTRWLGLPYGDQGLLISRKLYDEIGGYRALPLMEDVAIVRAIGKSRLSILSAQARTSAAKYERDGWRKRAWHNASLLIRYRLGASPEKLAKQYQ